MSLALTASLSPAPPPLSASEKAQARREERLKESRAAIETLKRIDTPKAVADDRKAMALAKVARLKEQIRALKLTANMDPEGTARLAARLARELGQAVKAYAAAGGSAAGLGAGVSAPMPTQTPAAEAAPGPADATTAVAPEATVTTGVVADVSPSPLPTPPSTPQTPGDDQPGPDGKNEDGTGKPSPQDPYRRAIEAIQQRGVDQALRAAEARGDAEFITEVKSLAAELKSLIRSAARALADRDDPGAKAVGDEAEKAVATLEREIASALQSLQGGGAGLSILV